MGFRFGDAAIDRIEEVLFGLDHEYFADGRPGAGGRPDWLAELVAEQGSWLTPRFYDPDHRRLRMSLHSWVVRVGGLTVVIDPCFGNGRDRGHLPWPSNLDTPYIERFSAAGVEPEEVDVVFCTHLHCDHCGWNTRLKNGRYVPTFPKARYLFVSREFDRWDARRADYVHADFNRGVFEDSIAPILEAGLADLIGDQHAISPHLSVEPAYGHTAGHSMVRLRADGYEALFSGDALHHPLQIAEPRLQVLGGDDLEMASRTILNILNDCADRGVLLLPAHFTDPHAGWVLREGPGFRFEPVRVDAEGRVADAPAPTV